MEPPTTPEISSSTLAALEIDVAKLVLVHVVFIQVLLAKRRDGRS